MSELSPIRDLTERLNSAEKTLELVSASNVRPMQLIKVAIICAQKTPLLLQCDPTTVVRSVIQAAEIGLVPGSALDSCYLVPFKNKSTQKYECQLIVSARGFSDLCYRSGLVKQVEFRCVYEGDKFEYEYGTSPFIKHEPTGPSRLGNKVTHAYGVIQLSTGGMFFEVMTRAEIEAIKGRSPAAKSGFSPWDSDFGQMAIKTVAKRTMKYVPKTVELGKAIALDNAQETGDYSKLPFDSTEASAYKVNQESAVDRLQGKIKNKTNEQDVEDAEAVFIDPFVDDGGAS